MFHSDEFVQFNWSVTINLIQHYSTEYWSLLVSRNKQAESIKSKVQNLGNSCENGRKDGSEYGGDIYEEGCSDVLFQTDK